MEIYRWYRVVDQANDVLLLKRNEHARWDWNKTEKLGTKWVLSGQRWEVPESPGGPVILQARIKANVLGRLVGLLFKVYPPTIRVEYRDGSVAEHRLVWRNVEAGFVVDSLPKDVNGVRGFLENGKADQVRAVTFVLDRDWFFERTCQLSWYRASLNQVPWTREAAGTIAAAPSTAPAS